MVLVPGDPAVLRGGTNTTNQHLIGVGVVGFPAAALIRAGTSRPGKVVGPDAVRYGELRCYLPCVADIDGEPFGGGEILIRKLVDFARFLGKTQQERRERIVVVAGGPAFKLSRPLDEVKSAGPADERARRCLVLHLVGLLKIRIEPGADVVIAAQPVEVGSVVLFGISVGLGLKAANRTQHRKAVDGERGEATLLQLSLFGKVGGIQPGNLQQSPAQVLILCHLGAE